MTDLTPEEIEKRTKLQEDITHLSVKNMAEVAKILIKNKEKYSVTARGTLMFDLISLRQETINEIFELVGKYNEIEKYRKDNIEDEYSQIRQRLEERNQMAMIKRKTRTKKSTVSFDNDQGGDE